MNKEKFDEIIKKRFEKCEHTLVEKGKDYQEDHDALAHFNKAAQISNTTPEKALWGMALKHLVSVQDMIETPDKRNDKRIDEKIGDMINYLVLLECVFKDKGCFVNNHVKYDEESIRRQREFNI